MFCVSIVKFKVVVLDILGYTVDFELRIVDVNVRVADGHDIDLATFCLFLKKGTLANAHADAHLRTTHMVKCRFDSSAFLLNQHIKLDVDVTTHGLVHSITVELRLLLLLGCTTSLCPGRLHFLNVVDHVTRARHVVFLHRWDTLLFVARAEPD